MLSAPSKRYRPDLERKSCRGDPWPDMTPHHTKKGQFELKISTLHVVSMGIFGSKRVFPGWEGNGGFSTRNPLFPILWILTPARGRRFSEIESVSENTPPNYNRNARFETPLACYSMGFRPLQACKRTSITFFIFGTLSVTFWSLFLMLLSLFRHFFAKLLLPDSFCGNVFFIFGTLSVTFGSLFLMLLSFFSSLFCQTPFAGLLLRQCDLWPDFEGKKEERQRKCEQKKLKKGKCPQTLFSSHFSNITYFSYFLEATEAHISYISVGNPSAFGAKMLKETRSKETREHKEY